MIDALRKVIRRMHYPLEVMLICLWPLAHRLPAPAYLNRTSADKDGRHHLTGAAAVPRPHRPHF